MDRYADDAALPTHRPASPSARPMAAKPLPVRAQPVSLAAICTGSARAGSAAMLDVSGPCLGVASACDILRSAWSSTPARPRRPWAREASGSFLPADLVDVDAVRREIVREDTSLDVDRAFFTDHLGRGRRGEVAQRECCLGHTAAHLGGKKVRRALVALE